MTKVLTTGHVSSAASVKKAILMFGVANLMAVDKEGAGNRYPKTNNLQSPEMLINHRCYDKKKSKGEKRRNRKDKRLMGWFK